MNLVESSAFGVGGGVTAIGHNSRPFFDEIWQTGGPSPHPASFLGAKKLLTVFNVGQGDAFLLQPRNGCCFGDSPLLVDTGLAKAKLHTHPLPDRMQVMITHGDRDHVGGLPELIRAGKVQRIIIPNYLPEITRINTFLGKHATKKIRPLNWRVINRLPCTLVSDGQRLCKHLLVLNPPKHPSQFKFIGNAEMGLERAFAILAERGIALPRDEITEYRTPLAENALEDGGEYVELARQFVHRFFITLASVLEDIGGSNAAYYVHRHVKLTSNQASVVFKYTPENGDGHGDWLFTGDADDAVFQRLISEGKNIQARYLKVPHHGSKGNISACILNHIAPRIAIVSHDNGKFGGATDPHPHQEVVDLLDMAGIDSYYTNPVIKNGIRVKPQKMGAVAGEPITFV